MIPSYGLLPLLPQEELGQNMPARSFWLFFWLAGMNFS
jgi:hypothetical protein